MVRKTALVAAMLSAFASQAYAMGLGEIRLNSVLNQPLNAEIELLSPTAADVAALRVVLAPPAAYNRAGVEREFFHTKLRFNVVTRPDGTAYIKVSSREPVREPYLDFLVEASWGAGQVLREYTVLIDPPTLMPAPAPVTRAPTQSAPVTQAPPPVAAPAPAPTQGAQTAASATYPGGDYQTQRNDTLWTIADRVRSDGAISIEQAMLGLLEANPDAFYDQNINNLKAGVVLRVPTSAEMTAITQAEALDEVRRQNRLWREGRSAATQTASSDAPADEGAPLATSSDPVDTSSEPAAQLKLVAPEVGEAASAAGQPGNVGEMRKELTMAMEAMEAQRQENQDLNARLKDLEDQLAKLHRLIELKDSELAQLGGGAAPADPTVVAPAATETTPDAQLTDPQADIATGEPLAEEKIESAPITTAEGGTPLVDETTEDTAVPPVDTTAEVETETAVPPPAPVTPQPSPAPVAEKGFFDLLMDNPILKWGAIAGAVLVALLAWMGVRRRRMEDSGFQESILADQGNAAPRAAAAGVPAAAAVDSGPVDKAEPAAETPTQEAGTQTDSSLFTDFAVSDMGAIRNDEEADPIAEADVYLAYGRYQQAEELVRSAIGRSPQRNDLKLKLLEVLFAAKNSAAFDAEAEAMLAGLDGQDDELWQRVAEMGQELNPSNPLYKADSAAAAASVAATAASTPVTPNVVESDAGLDMDVGLDMDAGLDMDRGLDMDSGVDLSEATAQPSSEYEQDVTPPADRADDNSLDFDLGELESFGSQAKSGAEMPVDDDLNFDLSDVGGEGSEDGTLAASDEVATKLDLARAYTEMGDPDGARSILEEVMEEGNEAQKAEARALLQTLA